MSLAFDPKDPEDVDIFSGSFIDEFGATETIVPGTAVVTIEDATGVLQPSMLAGPPDISGDPIVRQKVQGGINGQTYKMRYSVDTSEGRHLVGSVCLPIVRGC